MEERTEKVIEGIKVLFGKEVDSNRLISLINTSPRIG